jgi:hypothetical protein
MTLVSKELRFVDPDLQELPLEQLAAPGDSALAHCFALYHQRLEASPPLISAFNSNI